MLISLETSNSKYIVLHITAIKNIEFTLHHDFASNNS